ncbi:MAG: transglycosylase SLT domain-containing protein [Candidatus Accumulibacter sp.]|jgi:membrane-bound lytic murein transglycosylase D|nr:transglycosylase SLT domain-containing protein [Accumulibacter sp.]
MKKRFNSLMLSLVCVICCLTLLLAGCAGVAPPSERSRSRGDVPPVSEDGDAGLRSSSTLAPVTALTPVDLPERPALSRAIDLTHVPDDLFERIRHGFAMPELDDELVRYHQQWYLDRPDYLRRMVGRSQRYLYHIVEELDRRGMPMELALLPMVESAYNPMAYSRSKASGLWQFIPSTARRYNLDLDWWKDDRRDILASTTAALEYLQMIYELHGDWHLALASYNCGEGAVGRAIEKNQAQGLPTDYLSLSLPGETRNYVPKLQALKNIFRDPALVAELELPQVPNQAYFTTFTTDSYIDVKLAAKLAEMPEEEFVALNPAHNRPVIKSDTPLVIPAEKLETFVSNLEAHGDENKPFSTWRTYTLRPGDRLEKIASRFGMSVARLKTLNGIRGKTRPTPGMTLLVPGAGNGNDSGKAGGTAAARPGQSPKAPADSAPEAKPRRAVGGPKPLAAARAEKPASRAAPKVTRYIVRRGDTIYSIARQFKVAEEALIRRNRISPKKLKAGTLLTIPFVQKTES